MIIEKEYTQALKPESDNLYSFTLFTDQQNRHGNVLVPQGMDYEAYKSNPVVLFMHQQIELPIARVSNLTTKKSSVESNLEFDLEDPIATQVKGKYDRGFMNALSVGFMVNEYEFLNEDDSDDDIFSLLFAPRRFTQTELFETSAVTVPADGTAVRKQYLSKEQLEYYEANKEVIHRNVKEELSLDQRVDLLAKPFTMEEIQRMKGTQ